MTGTCAPHTLRSPAIRLHAGSICPQHVQAGSALRRCSTVTDHQPLCPLLHPRTDFKETGAKWVWPSQQCPSGRGHVGLGRTRAPSHRSLTVVFETLFGYISCCHAHTDKLINCTLYPPPPSLSLSLIPFPRSLSIHPGKRGCPGGCTSAQQR